jgi:hypothetical protein
VARVDFNAWVYMFVVFVRCVNLSLMVVCLCEFDFGRVVVHCVLLTFVFFVLVVCLCGFDMLRDCLSYLFMLFLGCVPSSLWWCACAGLIL